MYHFRLAGEQDALLMALLDHGNDFFLRHILAAFQTTAPKMLPPFGEVVLRMGDSTVIHLIYPSFLLKKIYHLYSGASSLCKKLKADFQRFVDL
jgi:hypothetical protein